MDKIDQLLDDLIDSDDGAEDENAKPGGTDSVLARAKDLRDKLLLFKKTDPFHSYDAPERQNGDDSRSSDIDRIVKELIDHEETIKNDSRRAKRALSIAKEAQSIRDKLYQLKYKSANRYVDGSYYTATLNKYKTERISQILDDLIKSEEQIRKDKKRLLLAETIAKEAENVNEKAKLLKKFEFHLKYYEKIIQESQHLLSAADNIGCFYRELSDNQEAIKHFNLMVDGMVMRKVKKFKRNVIIAFIAAFILMGCAFYGIFRFSGPPGDVGVLKKDMEYMTSEFEKTMEKAAKLHNDLNLLIERKNNRK